MGSPTPRRRIIERIMALVGLGVAGAALGPAVANAQTSYYGKYRGSVTNVNDPLFMGRILANVPSLGTVVLGWAVPSVPYAGAGTGFFMLPAVGAEVWIEFEGGNLNLPIWSGGFWGPSELPSLVSTQKIIKTSAGHTILLDDTVAGEHLQIVAAGGATITLDSNGITLGMGPTQMLISATGVSINGRPLRTAAATAALNSLLLND